MKLWIDDLRPAPSGYVWVKSVNEAIEMIETVELFKDFIYFNSTTAETKKVFIEILDLDHDAGDYTSDGGDYIKLLDWMEETGRNYPVHFHTANPVGRANMELIAKKNGWRII